MKVTIIGSGHVGLVSGLCFAEMKHEVMCVDHDADKIARLKTGEPTFHEPGLPELLKKHQDHVHFSTSTAEGVDFGDAIFVCVSTPSLPGGGVDMRYFEAVSRDIAKSLTTYRVIVEKSTVPIRTAAAMKRNIKRHLRADIPFDVASNPEFLREGAAIQDTLKPDRIVIGVESTRAEALLRNVYRGFSAPLVITTIPSAEMIKLASNAFLATRISFINAISRLCEIGGADIEEVAKGMGMDPRIGPHFLKAGIGYGGSCFPKDVDGLSHVALSLGYPFPLLDEVQRINADQAEHAVKRLREELWVLNGRKIALWGLAFKPDTDDVRESPALRIAKQLTAEGATVVGYDPVANHTAKEALPQLTLAESAMAAVKGADALVVATEWKEFAKADFKAVRAAMNAGVIFDGRNCLDRAALASLGFTVMGVGR